MMSCTIRAERPADFAAIGEVIRTAFAGMPYAAGDEAELVEALRAQNALAVSLVAEWAGAVIGQIAFSPAQTSDGVQGWFALGPVAVVPAQQRAGVGSQLVRAGLQLITGLGAVGCILTGNPAYYARFGFQVSPSNAPVGEPPEFFMVKLLRGERPSGPIFFHPAFHGAG
jgi:putative acetyltransferase